MGLRIRGRLRAAAATGALPLALALPGAGAPLLRGRSDPHFSNAALSSEASTQAHSMILPRGY